MVALESMSSPPILLPYQQKWVADQSDVKVYEKSRRIGISWAEAGDAALTAADRDRGCDVWFSTYNYEQSREFLSDVAWWVKKYQIVADEMQEVLIDSDRDILAYRINFASGFKVTGLPARPEVLRGKKGKIIIDEAAFVDDLPEILQAALANQIWGGKLTIISTHKGVENPFNELVEDCRAGKKPYSLHRTTFDDALEQGLYQRICLVNQRKWTKEGEKKWREEIFKKYAHGADEELLCIPAKSGEAYFSREMVEGCMEGGDVIRLYEEPLDVKAWFKQAIEPLIKLIPEDKKTYYGMDFARSSDLSVVAVLYKNTRLERIIPFIIEMHNLSYSTQETILKSLVDKLPRFRYACHDAIGNGNYLAETMNKYDKSCKQVEAVIPSSNWYLENFPKYKAAIEDREIQLPKDEYILDDHRLVKRINGIPKLPNIRTKGEGEIKRHGDSAIACLLAYVATLNEPSRLSYTTIEWY